MDEILSRFVGDLAGRLTGPLTLRLFLQPAVAIFYAVRVTAVILAILPYVLLRGPIARLLE